METSTEFLGKKHHRWAYEAWFIVTLLVAFGFYMAAILHFLYIFVPPEYYVRAHTGDLAAARAVSIFATVFCWLAAEYVRASFQRAVARTAPTQPA